MNMLTSVIYMFAWVLGIAMFCMHDSVLMPLAVEVLKIESLGVLKIYIKLISQIIFLDKH